jgi:hypothetical protein
MIMATTRSRAKQSMISELKNMPDEVLLNIFLLAHTETNYPYKHKFNKHGNTWINGRKKCLLPFIGKKYKNAYKSVPATRNNAVTLVSRTSAQRHPGPPLTRMKLNNSMQHPATRSAVNVRRRVNKLTR